MRTGTGSYSASATTKTGEIVREEHGLLPFEKPDSGTPNATVGFGAGVTINLGDYQSLRVDVQVTMPCLPNPTEVERMFAACVGWVEARLNDQIEKNEGAVLVKRR